MIVLTLIGAALGAVIFGLVVLLVPPRRSALTELGRFDALQRAGDPSLHVAAGSDGQSREVRLGAWAVGQFTRRGIRFAGLRADLMLTGRSFEAFMGRKILLAAGTFLAGILLGGYLQYGLGFSFPPGSTVLAAAVLGVAFFFTPDGDARKEARRRRAQFTEDLSVFLELVALEMAGYAAPEAAVPQAAARGGTWSMMLVRDTLLRARLSGQDSWDALSQLGQRIGVKDLEDLGALIKNVSDDGAQVRQTLSARAASMRRARLAAEQGRADERTQSMRLAQLLIAAGFALFLLYPAIVSIKV